MSAATPARYDAIVFDLLTALIDSWTLWNGVAGSETLGLAWRKCYLEITYGCGAYRPYEALVREAAVEAGLPARLGVELERRWNELAPWPEAAAVLRELGERVPLAVATNCSERLGRIAAERTGARFAAIVTAERVGFYKPRPEVYRAVLAELGTDPARTLFVAGSAADVPGAKAVGMPVYWHNRIGLPPHADARPEILESNLRPLSRYVLAPADSDHIVQQ
ncbi:MAG: haloacid dehalogenase [Proteobacteria bacterium]|nr:MAG: haloacid dehalogenase [Pseudomonadota bacterium]